MLSTRHWLWLAALWVGTSACSDQGEVDPSAVFGGEDGSTSNTQVSSFCLEYCRVLVEQAPGCERYNDAQRCERICGFYMNGACKTTYETFAACLRASPKAACAQPDGGQLTLMIEGCKEEYSTWIQCRDERDAGICPY